MVFSLDTRHANIIRPFQPGWYSIGAQDNKLNLFSQFLRWRRTRIDLYKELDFLRLDNVRLRSKLSAIQHAKEQVDKQIEERRREKEALRVKLVTEKKSAEPTQRVIEQLNLKITELREENDRLKRASKSRQIKK